MSEALHQAGLLVRLRAVRLTRAERALAAARAAAAAAEAEAAVAAEQARLADVRLAEDRLLLATDLDEAPARLALVDRAAFLQSVAKSAANDAAEQRRVCDEQERAGRRAMILARARHDRMAERARMVATRVAIAAEERVAIDTEEARRAG